MTKQKTKVINRTGSAVQLTMSTGGIQSQESMRPVENNAPYTISIDANATYREYWCAVQPGNRDNLVILSSDDCAEYSEVTLVAKNGKYAWQGTRFRDARRAPHQAPPVPANGAPQGSRSPITNASGARKSLSAKSTASSSSSSSCCRVM
jgi:hypothetical protein